MPATGHKGNRTYLLVVVCCGLTLVLSACGVNGQLDDASTQRRAHYCGAKLSNTLARLCTNFNGMRKKSDATATMPYHVHNHLDAFGPMMDEVEQEVQELHQLQDRTADTFHRMLITLQELNSHPAGFHRVRRQVVKECCIQSCTLETLRTYCAD